LNFPEAVIHRLNAVLTISGAELTTLAVLFQVDYNALFKSRHGHLYHRGLGPYKYMKYIPEQRPDYRSSDDGLEKLAPWSAGVQETYK